MSYTALHIREADRANLTPIQESWMTVSESPDTPTMPSGRSRRRGEWLTFLFLTVILAPVIAVAVVGGYGFLIWIYQMFMGPPGPPAA